MNFEKKINELNKNECYPFHMPGHKRNVRMEQDAYLIDITEIDGYDNLHKPEGMIKELEERISNIYGAQKSYVLINGSTCGILAAISAVTEYGDRILVARNSHKAAFNGVMIRGLEVDYIYPGYVEAAEINGSISAADIKERLRERKYSAVYITSPTYEGVVSDVESIAKIVHSYGIPLIVDEAHGAHFGISEYFPKSAIQLGADIVVQSIHKTLAGMTQTAVLHVNGQKSGAYGGINVEKLEFFLRLYQSSSPSYVLMASVDRCFRQLMSERSSLFGEYYGRLEKFYNRCRGFLNVNIFPMSVDNDIIFARDCGKVIIYAKGLSGREIYDYLRQEQGLQLEMACGNYALAMTSYMDTDEGFERLYAGLEKLDKLLKDKDDKRSSMVYIKELPKAYCSIAKVLEQDKELSELQEGIIAGDYIYIYPPGIPFIVPGECITNEVICAIMKYMEAGHEVNGVLAKDNKLYIKAIK